VAENVAALHRRLVTVEQVQVRARRSRTGRNPDDCVAVGCWITGSGTVSTRTSPVPCQHSARMFVSNLNVGRPSALLETRCGSNGAGVELVAAGRSAPITSSPARIWGSAPVGPGAPTQRPPRAAGCHAAKSSRRSAASPPPSKPCGGASRPRMNSDLRVARLQRAWGVPRDDGTVSPGGFLRPPAFRWHPARPPGTSNL
jgi:hypothetical protein